MPQAAVIHRRGVSRVRAERSAPGDVGAALLSHSWLVGRTGPRRTKTAPALRAPLRYRRNS